MVKAITIYDDLEYLRQISKPVNIEEDTELEENIKVLEEFCLNNEVMAMAAVQLGIPKRLIYLKNTNLDTLEKEELNEARVLINPVIIKREGLTEYWEACASCVDNFGLVRRPYKVEVEYYDINGNKHNDYFEGFESTVLSHEIDHLDGTLHIDIARKLLIMNQEERKKYRETHPYKIFSINKDYNTLLEEFKNIEGD